MLTIVFPKWLTWIWIGWLKFRGRWLGQLKYIDNQTWEGGPMTQFWRDTSRGHQRMVAYLAFMDIWNKQALETTDVYWGAMLVSANLIRRFEHSSEDVFIEMARLAYQKVDRSMKLEPKDALDIRWDEHVRRLRRDRQIKEGVKPK